MMDDARTQAMPATDCAFAPTADPAWLLVEEGFTLAREHEIESLFAVSNGYVGTRGSLAEGSPLSAPATFVAGIFDCDPGDPVPALAVAPDWMQLRGSVDGSEVKLDQSTTLAHRRILDLKQGIFWREWLFQDPSGRISRLHGLRFASLADRHVLVQSMLFTPVNHSGRVHLEIGLDPPADEPGRVELMPAPPAGGAAAGPAQQLALRTRRGTAVIFAAANRLRVCGSAAAAPLQRARHESGETWTLDVEMGRTYRFDRVVVVYTSRDVPQPEQAATQHLERLRSVDTDALIAAHVHAWAARWQHAEVAVAGDDAAQRALRFACYHLIAAANAEDERVSIGARALTGASYKGHVFWDTEIFMLPFYVFTDPPTARALLMYRYHTLPAARAKAQRLGYRGALYAWESADTGEEVTPLYAIAPDGQVLQVLSGQQEQHISADIAYAVWQYWQATHDADFLLHAGAEIIFETARFWASRVEPGADGRDHIRRIMGPDEYHEGVDDNAYTNTMAQWNLECSLELAALLEKCWPAQWAGLAGRLGLDEAELRQWRDTARRLYTGVDPQTGLIEQFRGYYQLEDIDLSACERGLAMDVLLGQARVQQSRIVKQADVLMLVHLLWERIPPAARVANFRFYEPRTAHGSSLSPAIHALLAARLGDTELALSYFRQAAEIDLSNKMGNAAGGVHAAALGGLWQAAVFGFAGMDLRPDGLAFAPHLPAGWQALSFAVQWRGRRLRVRIEPALVELGAEGPAPLMVAVADAAPVELAPGQRRRWQRVARDSWKEVPHE